MNFYRKQKSNIEKIFLMRCIQGFWISLIAWIGLKYTLSLTFSIAPFSENIAEFVVGIRALIIRVHTSDFLEIFLRKNQTLRPR